MRMVAEIMQTDIAWVNPDHKVRSAIILLKGHNVSGLPVLEGKQLVGTLHARHLLGIGDNVRVSEVMERDAVSVATTATVREAAEVMIQGWRERLPVVDGTGDLVGFISHQDLLSELRRPSDPLTELPWSDTMREWAIDQLRIGHEITIIFIDVDNFGSFNKRFGHVVGDMVLQNIANLLRDLCDRETDLVCRYGGDEFCIATLRHATEAYLLADRIEREAAALRPVEADDARVGVTTGLRGGRRTRERDQVHFAATLNDLINLASRDCMLRKGRDEALAEAAKTERREPPPTLAVVSSEDAEVAIPPEPTLALPARIELLDVQTRRVNGSVLVQVDLQVRQEDGRMEPRIFLSAGSLLLEPIADQDDETGEAKKESVEFGTEEETRKLVVEATVTAVKKMLPSGYDLSIAEVILNNTTDARELVTVHGYFTTPEGRRPVSGSAFWNPDSRRPIAAAVLASINRQMEILIPLLPGEPRTEEN